MKRTGTAVLSIALCATMASSCATQHQTQRLGGFVIGSLVGAAVALATEDHGNTAPFAAIGGAIGLGTMMVIQASEDRLASADVPLERDQWHGGPVASIDKVDISPAIVRPGDSLELATNYSVLAAEGESSTLVEETWTLHHEGKAIAVLASREALRLTGQWETSPQLVLPAGAEAGEYEIEHRIRVEGGFDTERTSFRVAS